MKTIVYIDGLNLYHALEDSLKWLDVEALSSHLLEQTPHGCQCHIDKIKYFTSKIEAQKKVIRARMTKEQREKDNRSAFRQNKYLDALKAHISSIVIEMGRFSDTKELAHTTKGAKVKIFKIQEKHTDVHLSVTMLNDAWLHLYESALLISNDSDFRDALKFIKEQFPDKKLFLFNPTQSDTSHFLKNHADYEIKLKPRMKQLLFEKSQLPDTIPNTKLHKPKEWG